MESYIRHPKHGPLPALLLVMTIVTGVVDAVSILTLGRVFVANMTGNIVFIAFAVVGTPGFSLYASLAALAGFLVGAAAGGRMIGLTTHRGRLLRNSAIAELVLLVAALILVLVVNHPNEPVRDMVAFLIAVAMGGQNAVVRKLAVPDLTTTVLTMTLTGIVADIRTASYDVAIRRALAVLCMFGGAALGAVLVLHVHPAAATGVAVALMAIVAIGATLACRHPAPWQEP
ncbi:MAG TPA: YoaK family protein [Micromonosporaceae bacterium]|jgi:uncharacterized membrane protein YoaK (UPF0700 family)